MRETIRAGGDERIYPVVKIGVIVRALQAEGISSDQMLADLGLAASDLTSPATRVSVNQVLACCRTAMRLSTDPFLAYHVGLHCNVATYGMYGFALFTCPGFQQAMRFAVQYHQLATPLADISFEEGAREGVWKFAPITLAEIDAPLYRFVVEQYFGVFLSLHRDLMGPSFAPRELRATYGPPSDPEDYARALGCPVRFGQPDNAFVFERSWLDGVPKHGDELTYKVVLSLCNQLLDELRLRVGVSGEVRTLLMASLPRRPSLDHIARQLGLPARTLRRKLDLEGSSFRKLADEVRMQMAVGYLRDTRLAIDDIAFALGFSDAANFSHAFRRWTGTVPSEFRGKMEKSIHAAVISGAQEGSRPKITGG